MILSAMQSASLRLVGVRYTTFFGASQKIEMELTDLVNEVAEDVAKYQDWQALTKLAMLAGDGSTGQFDLPADYDRQLVSSDIQRTGSLWGYIHVTDINDFLQPTPLAQPGAWTIYGGQVRFSPAPQGEARFPYITRNWALSSDSTPKAAFDNDSDTFLLPERLLTLGLVWRWRENKKLDASGDQEAFIKALDEYAGKDKGSSIIRRNGGYRSFNTSLPYNGTAGW